MDIYWKSWAYKTYRRHKANNGFCWAQKKKSGVKFAKFFLFNQLPLFSCEEVDQRAILYTKTKTKRAGHYLQYFQVTSHK